ncbi:MAG: hypothetical protein KDJ75_07530 [Alphaproteobacteria bacterium]|nr:hypothetical protein [Alphaproteobacteria bacterium]
MVKISQTGLDRLVSKITESYRNDPEKLNKLLNEIKSPSKTPLISDMQTAASGVKPQMELGRHFRNVHNTFQIEFAHRYRGTDMISKPGWKRFLSPRNLLSASLPALAAAFAIEAAPDIYERLGKLDPEHRIRAYGCPAPPSL